MQCNIVICDVQHATFKFFGVFDFRFKTGPSKKISIRNMLQMNQISKLQKKLQVSKIQGVHKIRTKSNLL